MVDYIGNTQGEIEKYASYVKNLEEVKSAELATYREKIAMAVDSMVEMGVVYGDDRDRVVSALSSDPIKMAEFIVNINTQSTMGQSSGKSSYSGTEAANREFLDFVFSDVNT